MKGKFENNVLDLSNVGMERLFKCLKTILLAVVVLVALGLCPGGGGVLSDEVTLIAEAEENETNTITFVSEEGYILGEADKKEYSCQLPQGLTVMADLSFMSTGNRPGYVLVGWKIKDGDDKIYNVINGTNANGIENIMMYYPNQDTTFVAVWGKAYSVTFHSEEGYMQGNVEQKDYVIQVAEGKKINIFPYAAREGYAIAGVKTDDDETLYVQNYRMQEGTKSIFDYVLNGDVIFNVQWVKACDVTFKTKMGSFYGLGNNETTLQVECNETIGKSLSYDRPRVTECKGYKFVGWRIDGDNTLYRDMEYEDVDLPENEEHIWKYVVTKDVTFEAVWEEAYNVTFKMSSDNIGYDGESTSQIKKGDKIGKKSAGLISTYEEYIVTGWKIEGTDTIVDVKDIYQYIPTSDITFIPIWEKAFNVRFETYDGYFDDDESGFTIKVRQGENLTGKHIPTGDEGNDDGSIIVGYKIASDDTLFVMNNSNLAMGEKCIYEYIPTSDVTFIAQWKKVDSDVGEKQDDQEKFNTNYVPENLSMDSNLNFSYYGRLDDNRYYSGIVEKKNADGDYDYVYSFGGQGWIPFNWYNQMPNAFDESGDYRIRIEVTDENGNVEYSDYYEFSWTKPSQKLAIPRNLRWSESKKGVATCDKVDNAYAYYYELFMDDESIGGGWTYDSEVPDYDCSSFIDEYGEDHQYTFIVKALVEEPTTYAHSEWSELSVALDLKSGESTQNQNTGESDKVKITDLCTNHKWDSGVVTKVATANEDGIKTYTCEVCHTTKTEIIAKTDDVTSSNNGSDTKEPNTTSQQSDSQQMPAQSTDSQQTTVQPSDSQSTSVEQTDKQTDNLTTFNIQNKKTYKKSKKIIIKDSDGIKSVSLNGKKIKSGKKKISFKLSKYKKYLKKKIGWNKLVVVDVNGNVAKIKFRVK